MFPQVAGWLRVLPIQQEAAASDTQRFNHRCALWQSATYHPKFINQPY